MSTNFPNSIDSFVVHHDNNNEQINAAYLNNMQDSIVAIENAIGATPTLASTPLLNQITSLQADYANLSKRSGERISIAENGGVGDGSTDNLTAYNSTKTAVGSNGIVYFPQNAAGNATYYFSSSPDLTNVIIDCDEGVILSFPTTNFTTFGTIKLRHSIKIFSRDRNNTANLPQNISGDWISAASTSDFSKPFGIQQPTTLDGTTFIKNQYTTQSDAVIAGVSTLTTNQVTWTTNAIGSANAGLVDAVLTPARVGKDYTASMDSAGMATANTTGRAGIIVVSSGEWSLFSVDSSQKWYLGTKATGVAWAETTGKTAPSGAYRINSFNDNMVVSARVISQNTVEFYINGVYFTSRTVNGNIQYVGWAFNGAANSGGACYALDFVACDSPLKQNGNTLNIAVFGDSISFGEASNLPWPNMLNYILRGISGISNVSISNYAHSGDTSAAQLTVLNSTPTGNFDYVLIMVGTNDIQGQVGTSTYKSNLVSMINKVRSDGSVPILGVPPMYIDQASTGYGFATSNYGLGGTYRSAVYRTAAENNVQVADVLADFGVISATNTQLRDNIHPQPLADVYIARSFASAIMQLRSKSVTILPSTYRAGTNVVSWLSAMPTAGYWQQGDTVYNTSPTILGTAGSQYTLHGWKRITSGTGNALNTDWVEMRNPTGT